MSSYNVRSVDRDRAEEQLAMHIKKATSAIETAPKQKHVRACIVYTWDYKSSVSIWAGLKSAPLHADEVQCFKALITIHKIIRQGHPIVLKEAPREIQFIENLTRSLGGNDGIRGYGVLIRAYVNFILAKLEYHTLHPEFNGLFEYEDYISLKGTDDPNEGFETIMDLMVLQDKVDSFQKLIFRNFRPGSNNECRISALVPLVEESYGIYKFITSMLIAMHKVTNQEDALAPLRQRYNAQHYALLKFYYECSNLRYLTSLITVPKLPQDPPNLTGAAGPVVPYSRKESTPPPPKPRTPTPPPPPSATPPEPEGVVDFWSQDQADEERRRQQQLMLQQQAEAQRLLFLQQQQAAERERQQREFDEAARAQAARQREAQERLAREQAARQQEGRWLDLEREMLNLRGQHERDQMTIDQYDKRIKQLEGELNQMGVTQNSRDKSKDELIKSLQEQLALWKSKYEQLVKLYQQLRKEHLELLGKYKASQNQLAKSKDSVERVEKMQAELRDKNMQLADMIRERDKLKSELSMMKDSRVEEIARLRKELEASEARVAELGRNKSAETGALLERFHAEKGALERKLTEEQKRIDTLMRELLDKEGDLDRLRREKDEEISILQAGMDQSLLRLGEYQTSSSSEVADLEKRMFHLKTQHQDRLKRILDEILSGCISKVDESVIELESPLNAGNTTATPEYVLSVIEKANDASTDFAISATRWVEKDGGEDAGPVVRTAGDLAQQMAQLMHNAKGILGRFGSEEEEGPLVDAAKGSAESSQDFFRSMMSKAIATIPAQGGQREEAVAKANRSVTQTLAHLTVLVESMLPKRPGVGEGESLDRVMQGAADAIEAASARLLALQRTQPNPHLSTRELQVHEAILESAMAMTGAIAELIRAATAAQAEIVSAGRTSGLSATEFYKRHNRWTEGLISAARAVASATTLLVETADGVIKNTHSLEQLIVASNEVAAATAQLVAAARVKAAPMSKTQDRLEVAAKAVIDASKALVRAVKAILAREVEDQVDAQLQDMSAYEFKQREMEQQVKILKLEKELTGARRHLGELRRLGYHDEEEGAL